MVEILIPVVDSTGAWPNGAQRRISSMPMPVFAFAMQRFNANVVTVSKIEAEQVVGAALFETTTA